MLQRIVGARTGSVPMILILKGDLHDSLGLLQPLFSYVSVNKQLVPVFFCRQLLCFSGNTSWQERLSMRNAEW